jgi:glycosyltransferase involved in cell wall biosynthesis
VLFVGTYRQRKRGKLLADVFESEVLPAVPDCELWMVCEDAPPRRGVKVLGRLSDTDLAELYGRAWAFCLPSTYEGFGIPYVEAMASGCPIVATPNVGALELTKKGEIGLIVTEEELGAELASLLLSPARRERFVQLGLAAAATYDLAAVAAAYEAIYRELLSKRGDR